MKICEIFAGIQGESTYAGLPCTFIRLTGCNLRCSYCDTVYAYEEGRELTEDEIIYEVRAAGIKTIEITGGEPLLQEDVHHLVKRLLDDGYKVLVETNGTLDIGKADKRAVVILDIKTPSSGMSGKIRMSNLDCLKPADEIKFVICGVEDYEWAKDFVSEHSLIGKCTILFSPAFGKMTPAELSGLIIRDRLDVRLNLQMHKHIYYPDARGV